MIKFYQSLGYTDDKVIGLGKRLEENEPYSLDSRKDDGMNNINKVNKNILVFAFSAYMLTVLSGCSSAPSVKPDSVLST